MRLSSVLLSATALLAQAASGFYLSSPEERFDDDVMAYAKLGHKNGDVVFSTALTELANITLDAGGDIEKSGFVLVRTGNKKIEWGVYKLAQASSLYKDTLTGPFAVEGGKFVYKGPRADNFTPQWTIQKYDGGWHISLHLDWVGSYRLPIVYNATLLVHES